MVNSATQILLYTISLKPVLLCLAVGSLSIVSEYPLLTEWKIRRVGKATQYLSIQNMQDTIKKLRSKIANLLNHVKEIEDSLNFKIITSDSLKKIRYDYSKAQLKWENAVFERMGNSLLSRKQRPTKKLKDKSERLYENYQRALRLYNEDHSKKET